MPPTDSTPALERQTWQDRQAWIGRQESARDSLEITHLKRVAATFGAPCPQHEEPLPPLWHWAFFQDPVAASQLGEDGHAMRGGLLPPTTGRQRMWAGGSVDFLSPLLAGVEAVRHSRVTRMEEKSGRTGALLFVSVEHEYRQRETTAIRETQEIVYRQPAPPKLALDEPMPRLDWSRTIEPTPTLLFRYSAITFNGHRIHYDWPYATQTEGYPGLVVHGPMIATWMVEAFCHASPNARPTRLDYRGLRPLVAPQPFEVGGVMTTTGKAALWAGNDNGLAHRATIHFEDAESRSESSP